MMLVTPSGWSLTETSRPVTLHGLEPTDEAVDRPKKAKPKKGR
jgi:hypothetical protein